jgi:hypothetical protein
MAANVWSATVNDVWSNTAAWSLSHIPTGTDIPTFNGTSIHNCTVDVATSSFASFSMTYAYTGIFNMGSCQFTCAGSWTFGANASVTVGSSLVTITAAATITSNNQYFYDFTQNASGTLCQLADAFNCHALIITAGSFNSESKAVTISGNFAWNSSNTLILTSTTLTMTGNSTAFTITASGTITITSLFLILQKSVTINTGTRTINRLITTNGYTYTFTATTNILTVSNFSAGDWQGTWVSSSPGTYYYVYAPANVAIINLNVTDCNNMGGHLINASDVSNTDGGHNAYLMLPTYCNVTGNLAVSDTWIAGTYYLIANCAMGANNLTLNAGVVVKTSGTYQIQHNGAGILTTSSTSINNKVYFTSKNDNTKGATITGSSGSPAYIDQTVAYITSTNTGNYTIQYAEFWYCEGVAATANYVLGFVQAANSTTKSVILQYVKIKNCYIKPDASASGCFIGTNGAPSGDYLGSLLFDNISIDSTNLFDTVHAGSAIHPPWVYTTSTVSNCDITPTAVGTTSGNDSGIIVEGGAGGTTTNYILNNLVIISYCAYAILTMTRGATATFYVKDNVVTKSNGTGSVGLGGYVVSGTNTTTMNNNIIYNFSDATNYGIKVISGSPTMTSDYNLFYNDLHDSDGAIGSHSIPSSSGVNPTFRLLPSGALIASSFAIPDGYAIGNIANLEMLGSDTFANLSIDATQYSPTGYLYQSANKVTMGINYNLTAFAPPMAGLIPMLFM